VKFYVFDNDENRWAESHWWTAVDAIPLKYRGNPRYTIYQKMVGMGPPL